MKHLNKLIEEAAAKLSVPKIPNNASTELSKAVTFGGLGAAGLYAYENRDDIYHDYNRFMLDRAYDNADEDISEIIERLKKLYFNWED